MRSVKDKNSLSSQIYVFGKITYVRTVIDFVRQNTNDKLSFLRNFSCSTMNTEQNLTELVLYNQSMQPFKNPVNTVPFIHQIFEYANILGKRLTSHDPAKFQGEKNSLKLSVQSEFPAQNVHLEKSVFESSQVAKQAQQEHIIQLALSRCVSRIFSRKMSILPHCVDQRVDVHAESKPSLACPVASQPDERYRGKTH